jgi:hypothetical protein
MYELANRGLDEEDAQPTIGIDSPTAEEEDWWVSVLPAIGAYIEENRIPFEVELVYLESVLHIQGQP